MAAAGTAGGGAAALLGALEGALGKGQDKTVTMTVTKSAVGAANQSTVTVTQQAQAAGLAAVTQLSFLTSTVFGTGVAPTVTITALPQMITQFVRIIGYHFVFESKQMILCLHVRQQNSSIHVPLMLLDC